mmetsp:Transcript_15642/g.31444  ORF Transcript_15642/g.31444 Transcript_15642/m.31444 type:complete len:163 (-) Transcript_15642:132-620(-)
MIIFGHASTLGRGQPGDALSDFVRSAARARAIYSVSGERASEQALAALQSLPNLPNGVRPLKQAWTSAGGQEVLPLEPVQPIVPPQSISFRKRVLERAERLEQLAADMDEDDGPVAYMRRRIAETVEYTQLCKQAEAKKAEARQQLRRETLAPFAPPSVYFD